MGMTLETFFRTVERSALYWVALGFFALYPLVLAVVWSSTATAFFLRREYRRPKAPPPLDEYPYVSVLIPCHDEEACIPDTLRGCLRIDYPRYEVVVVDDGSTDATVEKVLPFVETGRVRLVAREVNEGKAMAINDALPLLRGEIVLIIDADATPDPMILRYLVPHFVEGPRVGAVTGNPRVVDRDTLIAKIQVVEFTSIVSVLRRAHRIWGRVFTVSGAVAAFRRSALFDVGLFSPDMATEDIDVTWKLQMHFWDVRYEAGALVWIRVPRTLRDLWVQRRRWTLGLGQVLRRHSPGILLSWKRRRLWPMMLEVVLSVAWAHVFVALTALWALAYATGHPPAGAFPIPNFWGMLLATLALVQLGTGVLMDARYEPGVLRYFPVAVFYPLIFWAVNSFATVVNTPRGLFGRSHIGKPARWKMRRA